MHDAPRGNPLLRFVVPPVLVVAAVGSFVVLFARGPALDADLCPERAAGPSARMVALFDFRKPLDEELQGLPAALLRGIAKDMPARAELRTYILSGEAAEPRVLLERLCKPAGPRRGRSGRSHARTEEWNCADPPAAVSDRRMLEMDRFCARRDALSRRLDLLAARGRAAPVTDAYLIEALEDTQLEFAGTSSAKALYVLSDMIQHAPWYSHVEIAPDAWDWGRFTSMRQAQTPLFGAPPPAVPGLRTTLFYVPRRGITSDPHVLRTHWSFWQAYFRGMAVFEEQPLMVGYTADPLMGRLSSIAAATREQEQLEVERERTERLREQLQRENAALAEARERAAIERRQLEAREARWEAERAEERRRIEAERAEVERLKAELETRRDGR